MREITTARDHALFASELLRNLDKLEAQVADLSDDQRLQMVVSGGIRRHNADVQYTVAFAQAHAATALALAFTTTEVEHA